jgi:hypothetical protein
LPYRKVFARFGFGRRVEALLLSQLYPFENYVGTDGKPDIKIRIHQAIGQTDQAAFIASPILQSAGVCAISGKQRRFAKIKSYWRL